MEGLGWGAADLEETVRQIMLCSKLDSMPLQCCLGCSGAEFTFRESFAMLAVKGEPLSTSGGAPLVSHVVREVCSF